MFRRKYWKIHNLFSSNRNIEFEGQFTCLGENTEKYRTFSVLIEKLNLQDNLLLLEKILKNTFSVFSKKLFSSNWKRSYENCQIRKSNHKNYSLPAQDLCQAHYQFLLIVLLKEFIKLNINTDTMIQICETCRIKYKDCNYFPKYKNSKDDLIEQKCLCWNENYQKNLDENLKYFFLIQTNFQTMISISLFYHCEKVFTNMNIWMIGKNLLKLHYLKKI